jgi:hypothetical protein
MPGIAPEYKPNDRSIKELGNKERQRRAKVIETAWKYYRHGYVRKPLKIKPGDVDDNVILNHCAHAIDKSVSFFVPEPPRFVLPRGVNREPGIDGRLESVFSVEQEAIHAFLEHNEFDHQIVDIALSGFISGHNFLRLYLPENGDTVTADNPPTLALIDPRHVNVFWDTSNIRRTLFYRLTWKISNSEYRIQDIVPTWLVNRATNQQQPVDMELGWQIIEYRAKTPEGEYTQTGVDEWPYPFAPLIDWKNRHAPHEYYGESDLLHADLNDAINFVASNTARIIKYHAHPKTVMIGGDPSSIQSTSVDGLWSLPDGVTVENLEMQSDLSSSLAYLEKLETAYFTQMHVLSINTIKDKVGALTNFGVRMLFKDMLDVADTKHSLYGSALAEMVRRALVLMGFEDVEKPKVEWVDPLPANILELTTALKTQDEMGVISKQTIQEKLQLDPAIEDERMGDEQGSTTDALVDTLIRLGERGNGGFMNGGRNPALNGGSQRMPLAS